jgi:hypothetical protein
MIASRSPERAAMSCWRCFLASSVFQRVEIDRHLDVGVALERRVGRQALIGPDRQPGFFIAS